MNGTNGNRYRATDVEDRDRSGKADEGRVEQGQARPPIAEVPGAEDGERKHDPEAEPRERGEHAGEFRVGLERLGVDEFAGAESEQQLAAQQPRPGSGAWRMSAIVRPTQ